MTGYHDIDPEALGAWQAHFEAALPRIESHARVKFRDYGPERREEAVAATVAIAWKSYLDLRLRGDDPARFISVIAEYAARQVRDGRHVTGQEKANDALSPRAQRKKNFFVQSLPACDTADGMNEALEALVDDTQTPPPDNAAFRIDFPEWLKRHNARKRDIIQDMAKRETTSALADKYGSTQSRISQIRREAAEDWRRFHGEDQDEGRGR